MTSMVAAPTMTSMYASAPSSLYMPAATVAAPTYAAPQTVVAAPEYATYAAPQMYAAPEQYYTQTVAAAPAVQYAAPAVVTAVGEAIPAFNLAAPVSLTQGLVPPSTVEAERLAYEKALNAQLDKQTNAVLEEAKIKKVMMQQTAATQLEEFKLQLDEKCVMDKLRIDQEAQTMINGLKEAAITQQTEREERAAILVAEYGKKKALEDMAVKSYQLQKNWFDQETKLQSEYQATLKKAGQLGISGFNV